MALRKFLVCGDSHGDMCDRQAIEVVLDFQKDFKPDIVVHLGDFLDLRPIRRGADEDERRDSMIFDVMEGKDFIQRLKPNFVLLGNHDQRLWDLAHDKPGLIGDFAKMGVDDMEAFFKKLGVKWLPYDKRKGVLKIGHLKIIHGYHCGIYAAKQHGIVYGACLHGHTHAIDEFAIPGLERRVARSIGCLCKLDYRYNRANTSSLRHAHGFAYGIINDKTGNYTVFQAEKVGSKWIMADSFIDYPKEKRVMTGKGKGKSRRSK